MNSNSSLVRMHPILKIFAFIFLLLIGAGIFTFIGLAFASFLYNVPLNSPEIVMQNTDALIVMQIFSAIGTFILPPLIYAKFFEVDIRKFLKIDKAPKISIILFTIIIFILANFVSDLAVKIMNFIPFENMDNDMIKGILQTEKNSAETLKRFLDFSSPIKFVVVFFMMAILPGLGEELTFRGVFMNLFKQVSNNKIIFPIVFSGFIFAIIHLQLHNFLAIFFMGIMLGTIYHLTGNIWYSIIAHLFNNGLIVIASYLKTLGHIQIDLTSTEQMPMNTSIIGSIIFLIVFYLFAVYTRRVNDILI